MKLYVKNQGEKKRYKHKHTNFYNGLLKIELYPVNQDNLNLIMHYIKKYKIPQRLHF